VVEECFCFEVDWVVASGSCDCGVECVCGEEVGEGSWWLEEVDVEVSLDGDGGCGGGGVDVVDESLEGFAEGVIVTFGAPVNIYYGVLRVVFLFVGVELDDECLGVVDGVVGGEKDGGVKGLAGVDGDIGAVVDIVAREGEHVGGDVVFEAVLGERNDVWSVREAGEVGFQVVVVGVEGADVGVVEAEGFVGVNFVVELYELVIELLF
jgi:hypothetical protein